MYYQPRKYFHKDFFINSHFGLDVQLVIQVFVPFFYIFFLSKFAHAVELLSWFTLFAYYDAFARDRVYSALKSYIAENRLVRFKQIKFSLWPLFHQSTSQSS